MKLTIEERKANARKELYSNWLNKHQGLGLTRDQLRSCFTEKAYLKTKLIGELRKKKIISLSRKRYFIKMEHLKTYG